MTGTGSYFTLQSRVCGKKSISRLQSAFQHQGVVVSLRYLYHDVHVLAVVQQTEVGVEVQPVVPLSGVGHGPLPLLQGLQEGLPPLGAQVFQEPPLIGQYKRQSFQCRMASLQQSYYAIAELIADKLKGAELWLVSLWRYSIWKETLVCVCVCV